MKYRDWYEMTFEVLEYLLLMMLWIFLMDYGFKLVFMVNWNNVVSEQFKNNCVLDFCRQNLLDDKN